MCKCHLAELCVTYEISFNSLYIAGVIDDETERYKVMEEIFNKEQREKDLQKTIEEFKKVD